MADAPSPPSNTAYTVPAHTCHAHDCEAPCPPRFLMCGPHWRRLPPAAQRVIWAHYRPGQERDKKPTAHYLLAMDIAIILVAFIERRWSQRHCFDQIANACLQARRQRVPDGDIDVMVRAMGWEAIAKGHKPEPEQLVLGAAAKGNK